MKTWMKIALGAIVWVLVLVGNLMMLRGSYEYTCLLPINVTSVDDFRVVMDRDDVLEIRNVAYDPDEHKAEVSLRAIQPGDVMITIQAYSGDRLMDFGYVHLVVDRFLVVVENSFLGSLYVPYLAWEFLLVTIVMLINIAVVLRRLYKTSHYSYQAVSYTGVFFLTAVYACQWGWHLFIYKSNSYLTQFYYDLMNVFSGFAVIIFPFIFLLSLFLIISNIVLIRREGRRLTNTLGIVLGFVLVGMTVLGVMMYPLLDQVMDVHNYIGFHISYFIESCVYAILAYLESMMLGTIVCTLRAQGRIPSFDKDYMIILGCAIKKDGTVTPLLQGRCDRAIRFAKKQEETTGKKLIYIASGGQGSDEVVSEAEAIRNYLVSRGIPEEQILLENRSTNTYENMKYSYEII